MNDLRINGSWQAHQNRSEINWLQTQVLSNLIPDVVGHVNDFIDDIDHEVWVLNYQRIHECISVDEELEESRFECIAHTLRCEPGELHSNFIWHNVPDDA